MGSTPFDQLPPGRHDVMGDSLFLIIDHAQGKGREGARLEAHRRYIDVQYIIPRTGAIPEDFGWRPTNSCASPPHPYDKEKDIIYFDDQPTLWFALPVGHFALFFPGDAHAPAAGQGLVHKAVVKVAVDW